MTTDRRVATATSRNDKAVSEEVTASFRTVYTCPHCDREQCVNSIVPKSGLVKCRTEHCQKEFRILVPPVDSQLLRGGLINPDPDTLIITADGDALQANRKGAVGAAICGRGATVLEAVGDYAINSRTLKVRTEPAELVDTKFKVSATVNRAKLATEGCPRRD